MFVPISWLKVNVKGEKVEKSKLKSRYLQIKKQTEKPLFLIKSTQSRSFSSAFCVQRQFYRK